MTCYHPVPMFRLEAKHPTTGNNLVVHHPKPKDRIIESFQRSCGSCVGCRLSHSTQWAIRCMHEASLHENNSFITLTYAPEHLPPDRGLHHEHFQGFMKRLRDRLDYIPLRYYMCGEYGEELGRPHFHACLFGYDFPDKKLWRTIRGNKLFVSPLLMDVWPFGFSTVGSLTFQSAAYVSRYIMKKRTGKQAASYYELIDPNTGEIFDRRPEYNQPSLKPGLARGWFDKFSSDVYPSDEVVLNGKTFPPPKYYDRCYERDYPEDMEEVRMYRLDKVKPFLQHQTPRRLYDRETVKLAQISTLKRGMSE